MGRFLDAYVRVFSHRQFRRAVRIVIWLSALLVASSIAYYTGTWIGGGFSRSDVLSAELGGLAVAYLSGTLLVTIHPRKDQK